MPDKKQPFDIDLAMERIREAVRPFPPAALNQLAQEGLSSPFQVLVACIISTRTLDEATLPMARGLLARAPDPEAMVGLTTEEIDRLIQRSSFHEAKARQIQAIARTLVQQFGGELPCREEVLRSFPGVGPKCAHLVLSIACGQLWISVDIHVHRVTNRWGYVSAPTPERTMTALELVLPKRYWAEINARLVPFGKHICTGRLPRCSTCPVLEMCRQVGVTAHR